MSEGSTNIPPNPAFTSDTGLWRIFKDKSSQKLHETGAILAQLEQQTDLWKRVTDIAQPFQFAFFGVGDGEVELELVRQLASIRGGIANFSVYCEDPSRAMKTAFEATLKTKDLENLPVNYQVKPIEDVDLQIPDSDLVIASHMLYYVPNWKTVEEDPNSPLHKIYNASANKDGAAIIVVQASGSDIFKLRDKYNCRGVPEISAEMVAAELNRLDLPFNGYPDISGLDATSFFQDGSFNPTYEGQQLLAFIFRHPWREIPIEKQIEIGNDISQMIKGHIGTTQIPHGHASDLWLAHVDGYIWLRKRWMSTS